MVTIVTIVTYMGGLFTGVRYKDIAHIAQYYCKFLVVTTWLRFVISKFES